MINLRAAHPAWRYIYIYIYCIRILYIYVVQVVLRPTWSQSASPFSCVSSCQWTQRIGATGYLSRSVDGMTLRARLLSYTGMPLLSFNFWDTNMATNTKEQSPCTESDAINTWSINQRFGNHARYSIPVKYINRSDVWVSNRIQSHVYLAQIAATATSPSPRNTGAYDGGLLQGENGRASTCNEEDLGPTEMRSIGQGPIVLICLGYV